MDQRLFEQHIDDLVDNGLLTQNNWSRVVDKLVIHLEGMVGDIMETVELEEEAVDIIAREYSET
jgi:hypothetical protein